MSAPQRGAPPLVVAGGRVVCPATGTWGEERDVGVRQGRIEALAPPGARRPPGARVLDATGMAVLPGFVQTHVHLTQTLFRGWADDRPLLPWLRERIWPLEGAHDPETNYASAALGAAELLLGGTTCALDMGTVHCHDAVFEAARDVGLRLTSGKALMDADDVPDALRESTAQALDSALALVDRWHGAADGRLRVALCPRFALSCTDELHQQVGRIARKHGLVVHTHAAEQAVETELVRSRTGRGNVAYLDACGLSGPHVCLAHCIWLDDTEVDLLARTGTRVLHCPSSNLKLGSGVCDVPRLQAAGVCVSLGADGAPCNNRLCQWTEMRLAALVQAPRHGPGALRARRVLAMATVEGARALGLDGEVGAVAPGYRADLQIVRLDGVHLEPGGEDLAARLVYAATARDVHTVLVGGRVVVEAGALRSTALGELRQRARRGLERVLERAGVA